MTQLLAHGDAIDRWEGPCGCALEYEADWSLPQPQMTEWPKERNATIGSAPAVTLVLLDEIWSSDRVLKLRETVQAQLYWADELWTCELENLRIIGFGESKEQAISVFFEDFFATYDGLVHEDDSSLTGDAKLAKRALQKLVLASAPVCDMEYGLVGAI